MSEAVRGETLSQQTAAGAPRRAADGNPERDSELRPRGRSEASEGRLSAHVSRLVRDPRHRFL